MRTSLAGKERNEWNERNKFGVDAGDDYDDDDGLRNKRRKVRQRMAHRRKI